MLLTVFWNKAIEYHCLCNNHEIVFVAVSQESLSEIFENYVSRINESNANEVLSRIEKIGGIEQSYFNSIGEVFFSSNDGAYPFLKFSFFILCAFELNTTNGYWENFNSKIHPITGRILNSPSAKRLLNSLIDNLKRYCTHESTIKKYNWNRGRKFLDLNFYGKNTNRVIVGKIYAHSIFTASVIEKVKKAMYVLDYAYSKSVEYLDEDELSNIIEVAGLSRIERLSSNTDLSALINQCLTLWLRDWEANEEEENSFNIRNYDKSAIKLSRIWYLDGDQNNLSFKWYYGFISKENLGSEGRIILNNQYDIYINLEKSSSLGDKDYLYIIDNLSPDLNCPLSSNEPKLEFANRRYYDNTHFSLKKINNTPYFLQIDKPKLLFSNEKIYAACIDEISNPDAKYCGELSIKNNESSYRIYLISDSIDINGVDYVKTNNDVGISFSGITAGVPGRRSYISAYPVRIVFDNTNDGQLEIYGQDESLFESYQLSDSQFHFNNSILLADLPPGEYKVKFKLETGYVVFTNGEDYEKFEIISDGTLDRRVSHNLKDHVEFEYSPVNCDINHNNLDPDFVLFFDVNGQLFNTSFLSHKLFDFCFIKRPNSDWIINTIRDSTFAAILDPNSIPERPANVTVMNYDSQHYKYTDTSSNAYAYEAKAQERYSVGININQEMYTADRFTTAQKVFIDCYVFELTNMDARLESKFPGIEVGNRVHLLSNNRDPLKPELLLRKLTQEIFPFKFCNSCK